MEMQGTLYYTEIWVGRCAQYAVYSVMHDASAFVAGMKGVALEIYRFGANVCIGLFVCPQKLIAILDVQAGMS